MISKIINPQFLSEIPDFIIVYYSPVYLFSKLSNNHKETHLWLLFK